MNLSPHSTKRFSIVIPTKNGGRLFTEALKSLQNQSIWDFAELIIVDSGSTDETVDAARSVGAKIIEIAPKDFNHGATRDYGISLAKGDIVILMVQDAVANNAYLLESIIAPFNDPGVAGVYARQIPQSSADVLTKRNLNNWLTGRPQPEIKFIKTPEWYNKLQPIEKYFFCNFDNVCSAIRKSVWQKNQFGQINFGEDIDWSERVLKAGFKIVYEPAAAVIHSHDRPISYEYKRTYICHRKLYRQFGLHLVPSLRGAFRSWVSSSYQDIKYVLYQDAPIRAKLKLFTKIPQLNFLNVVAQYRAAKDEAVGKVRHIHGV